MDCKPEVGVCVFFGGKFAESRRQKKEVVIRERSVNDRATFCLDILLPVVTVH